MLTDEQIDYLYRRRPPKESRTLETFKGRQKEGYCALLIHYFCFVTFVHNTTSYAVWIQSYKNLNT